LSSFTSTAKKEEKRNNNKNLIKALNQSLWTEASNGNEITLLALQRIGTIPAHVEFTPHAIHFLQELGTCYSKAHENFNNNEVLYSDRSNLGGCPRAVLNPMRFNEATAQRKKN
jgi:hypothetical protein